MFPKADVPVVQLSIDATKSIGEHVELGRALAPLRERGVLIVGSGNVVHNLAMLDWSQPDSGTSWARSFDAAATAMMARDPAGIGALGEHPDAALAIPTPDHFLPLVYVAGVAAASNRGAEVLVEGCAYGSLSMTSYIVPG